MGAGMTDPIRDAAKALLDAHDRCATTGEIKAGWDALRAALSAPQPPGDWQHPIGVQWPAAPQPAADERVAELMRHVEDVERFARMLARNSGGRASREIRRAESRLVDARRAVESSARALLAAGLEDASQALAFRMLVRHWNEFGPEHGFGELIDRLQTSAMQKGTP